MLQHLCRPSLPHILVFFCFREQISTESTESVQLFWKADSNSIHLTDDGNSPSRSFSFGQFYCKLNFFRLCIEFSAGNNHPGCWQIESLLLRKRPVSCTRTLPSLWLCPPSKDIMVCNLKKDSVTRCYMYLPCVSDPQEPYLHTDRRLLEKPSPWWAVGTFLVSSLWPWKMYSRPSKM